MAVDMIARALAAKAAGGGGITGELRLFAGRDADFDGWLLCDGRPVKQEDYPELFSLIGVSFGDPSAEIPQWDGFCLPDARGKVVGVCSDTHALGTSTSLGSGGQLQTLFVGKLFIHI